VDLAERYRTAVQAGYDSADQDPGLLPRVLSEACVAILPVAGAGISVIQELRIPLGASDTMATAAERLQTTLGEGPCLDATATPMPLTAGLEAMAARWPVFHAELVRQTPYRSVAALPLIPRTGRRLGALDLYLTGTEPMEPQLLFQLAGSIATPMAQILAGAPIGEDADGITMPTWLNSDVVRARMHVWSAVGQLMAHSALENADALALLRAYAFGHETDLDDVAARVAAQSLDVHELLAP
jgi:hypothetical protein